MEKGVEFKEGDHVSWLGGRDGRTIESGPIVERVRAKTRPRYDGTCTHGVITKRSVSLIVRDGRKYRWIEADDVIHPPQVKSRATAHVKPAKPQKMDKSVEPITVRSLTPHSEMRMSSPFLPVPGLAMPPPFRNNFDCLTKYLPAASKK